ncbi:biotin--[acetyl-CoA-carboxylase] ligase [Arsenicicoccus sp. oral taxon 190]|uniref:biotin--[acetyl-CoA-carboxylase] ligase n=1 Tax=Arsenicicoccus sp. oral taxon 190 TaxID=1658671 RepID=UPI0009E5228B|nr:biotin--[acetyl-CoA-carboxylase] ligase [Arsenicicoccus sp. oral taxon 190]
MSPWASVEVRDAVGSTNAELLADPRPWHVLTTDHQVAGRGRLARSWQTPAGMAVALSATVPVPPARTADVGWLPLLTGLAVRDALTALAGPGRAGDVVLKWPNDVLVRTDADRKVCGVLCELAPASSLAVLGMGINVHQGRAELPVETATSLALCGIDVGREEVVLAVLQALAHRHSQWASPSRMPTLVEDYRQACTTLGRRVAITLPTGAVQSGEAVRVDDAGRIVIRTLGRELTHAAGDVVHATLTG